MQAAGSYRPAMDGDRGREGRTSPVIVSVKEEPMDDDHRPLVMDTGRGHGQPPPPGPVPPGPPHSGLLPAFPQGPYPAFPPHMDPDMDEDSDDSSDLQDDLPQGTGGRYLSTFSYDSGDPLHAGQPSRAKREFVPEEKKDRTYWNKRQKNNISARKSRMKRKSLEKAMENKLNDAIKENVELRMELEALRTILAQRDSRDSNAADSTASDSGGCERSCPSSAGSPALSSTSSGLGTSRSGSVSGQSADHSASNSPALMPEDEPPRKPFQLKVRLHGADDSREGGSPDKNLPPRGLSRPRGHDASPGRCSGSEGRGGAGNSNVHDAALANRARVKVTSCADPHLQAMTFAPLSLSHSSSASSSTSSSSSSSGYSPHPAMRNSFASLPPAAHLPHSAAYWSGRYPPAFAPTSSSSPTDLTCHNRKPEARDAIWGERSEGYGSWGQQESGQGHYSRLEGYGSWIQQRSDQGHQSTRSEGHLSLGQRDSGQCQGQSVQNNDSSSPRSGDDEGVYGRGEISKSGWLGEGAARQRVPLKCRMKQDYTGSQSFSQALPSPSSPPSFSKHGQGSTMTR